MVQAGLGLGLRFTGFEVEGLRFKGNTRVMLGFYWDNGKENGDYYLGFRV